MRTTYYVTENDDGVPIRTQLVDDRDMPVQLFGVLGVKFHMRLYRSKGATAKVDGDCVVIDAAQGVVEYTFVAADTDAPGRYDAEWEVTFASGAIDSFPRPGKDVVQVEAQLA